MTLGTLATFKNYFVLRDSLLKKPGQNIVYVQIFRDNWTFETVTAALPMIQFFWDVMPLQPLNFTYDMFKLQVKAFKVPILHSDPDVLSKCP